MSEELLVEFGHGLLSLNTKLKQNLEGQDITIRWLKTPMTPGSSGYSQDEIYDDPKVILRFHNIEGLDVLLGHLLKVKEHLQALKDDLTDDDDELYYRSYHDDE